MRPFIRVGVGYANAAPIISSFEFCGVFSVHAFAEVRGKEENAGKMRFSFLLRRGFFL